MTSVSFESFQVPPYIWSRAPRWPLSCYLMYLCDSCMFFHDILRAFPFSAPFFLVHLFPFLSPYIESIWSPISPVFSDVFASPMWAELNDVKAPSLGCLAGKLPEIVFGSRADSSTLTCFNGFKRWRGWFNRFPEVAVLPATPAYVSLYLLSALQASSSPAPVQNAFYSICWAHDVAGFDSLTNHFPRRSWSPLREGYYTLLPKSSLLHPKFYKSCFRISIDLWWTQDSWPWRYWPLRGS